MHINKTLLLAELHAFIEQKYQSADKESLLELCQKTSKEQQAAFLSSMNSYLGIMKHYKTHKLRKRMLFKKLSGWWWDRVYLSGGIAKFVLKIKPMKSKHGYRYTNN